MPLEGGRGATYQFLMLFQVPGTKDVDRVPEIYSKLISIHKMHHKKALLIFFFKFYFEIFHFDFFLMYKEEQRNRKRNRNRE